VLDVKRIVSTDKHIVKVCVFWGAWGSPPGGGGRAMAHSLWHKSCVVWVPPVLDCPTCSAAWSRELVVGSCTS
jgi:hypothetical protein